MKEKQRTNLDYSDLLIENALPAILTASRTRRSAEGTVGDYTLGWIGSELATILTEALNFPRRRLFVGLIHELPYPQNR